MTLVECIFNLISNTGVSAKKLAEAIGVSSGNVTDWKNGRSKPSSETVAKIADYFNVSTDYLLGRTQNPSHIASSVNVIQVVASDGDKKTIVLSQEQANTAYELLKAAKVIE